MKSREVGLGLNRIQSQGEHNLMPLETPLYRHPMQNAKHHNVNLVHTLHKPTRALSPAKLMVPVMAIKGHKNTNSVLEKRLISTNKKPHDRS